MLTDLVRREAPEQVRASLIEDLNLCDAFAAEAADAATLEQARQCVNAVKAKSDVFAKKTVPPAAFPTGATSSGTIPSDGLGTLGTALLVGSGVLVAGAIVFALAK